MNRGTRAAGWVAASIALSVATLSSAADAWTSVRSDAIRSHVEFLAGDLLEGRAAASRGYDIAAAYVAAQFMQSGLKPAGDTNGYFQAIPLLEATPVLPGSSAELVVDKRTHAFEYGTDYLPSADYMSASSTLTAPMTFVGFGIDAPDLGYSDFTDVDLTGRIAVILTGAPAKFPHTQRAYYSSNNIKFPGLIERGAVGVVMISSAQDEKLFPWERVVAASWAPQMRWLDAEGKPHAAYESLKLRFRFNQEAAARLFADSEKTLEAALAAADAGEPQSFELPGLLTLSATTGLRRTESTNVIASSPGTDLRDEAIVITAHLDHMGRGSAVNGDSIYNGAQDNALGVGIVLEMARALAASGVKTRRTIVFAAVTAEEKGLLGSDFLAQHPAVSGTEIVANVNIDMPLLFTPTFDFVALGDKHSSLGPIAQGAVAAEGYRLSPDPTPEQVSFVRSDQFSFVRQGIPAIVLMGGYQSRDKRVDVAAMRSEFLKDRYHQPNDDLTGAIDYTTAAALARVNLRVAIQAANAPARPRWKNGDFLGKAFSRSRGDAIPGRNNN